jgi:hypothetical protein
LAIKKKYVVDINEIMVKNSKSKEKYNENLFNRVCKEARRK